MSRSDLMLLGPAGRGGSESEGRRPAENLYWKFKCRALDGSIRNVACRFFKKRINNPSEYFSNFPINFKIVTGSIQEIT